MGTEQLLLVQGFHQLALYDKLEARARRAHLDVGDGQQLLEQRRGPLGHRTRRGVEAPVEVAAGEGVILAEDEADAVHAVLGGEGYGLLVAAPGRGVVALRGRNLAVLQEGAEGQLLGLVGVLVVGDVLPGHPLIQRGEGGGQRGGLVRDGDDHSSSPPR